MPLFVPAMDALGIDKTWFAIVLAINLQTAFISPPVGFSLFYLQSASPKEVTTAMIHRGALPFVGLQLLVLAIVIWQPGTVTWLVNLSNELDRAARLQGGSSGPSIETILGITLLVGVVLIAAGRMLRRGRAVAVAG